MPARQEPTSADVVGSMEHHPSWRTFCFEPWLGAHESWCTASVSPPGWNEVRGRGPLAQRIASQVWLRHFGVTPTSVLLSSTRPFDTFCEVASMSSPHQLQALDRIGMAVTVGRTDFASSWGRQSRELMTFASPQAWKRAIAEARARPPLPAQESTASSSGDLHDSIRSSGLLWIAKVCHSRWPQLWSRLRTRFPYELARSISVESYAPQMDAADIRRVLRLWRDA